MRRRGVRDPPLKPCTDPWGFGVSATLNQIHLQAQSVSGFPGTWFEFIYRSMRFQGLVGPPLNCYAGP